MVPTGYLKQKMSKDKDKITQLYHEQNKSLTDIGKLYGCSRQYVQLVFKELGIKRRTRMEALKFRPLRRKSKYDFTPADDKFIAENYHHLTDPEIAGRLNKPLKSIIYRRLIVLGRKKVNRRNFSEAEDEFIRKNFKIMTDSEIARRLDRSLISVTHHRNRILNCVKRETKNYSDYENSFIKENYSKLTDKEIADTLNRTKASVAIHRNEVLGLAKTRRRRKPKQG